MWKGERWFKGGEIQMSKVLLLSMRITGARTRLPKLPARQKPRAEQSRQLVSNMPHEEQHPSSEPPRVIYVMRLGDRLHGCSAILFAQKQHVRG